ncbi:hypothetical protein TNCV_3205481 [Trichonephila clavipes]|nr:hypothetical protein TNCV_3205481 [Trichonephila clavipes]
MQRLDDTGKSESTPADINVITAVVNRGPQQSGNTEQFSKQLSQRWTRHCELSTAWSTNVFNVTFCRRLRE